MKQRIIRTTRISKIPYNITKKTGLLPIPEKVQEGFNITRAKEEYQKYLDEIREADERSRKRGLSLLLITQPNP